jgi:hypothetical protein
MTCHTCDLEKIFDGLVPYKFDTSWNRKIV